MNKIVSNFYLIRLDGEPVYVGYTNRTIKRRFSEHKRDKDFGEIEPTVENLESLEYSFTWDMELISQYSKEVSARETELVIEYGTQDSVWQRGTSGNLGGQTWNDIKHFVRANRNNPKFRGLSDEVILTYLEEGAKAYRYMNHFVRNMNLPEVIYIGSFVNGMRLPEARYISDFVNGMKLPEVRYLRDFVNTMKLPEARYMMNFVSNMNLPEVIYIGSFVSTMNLPEVNYMSSFVRGMNLPEAIYVQSFVNNMNLPEVEYIMHLVSHMDLPEVIYIGSFVGNMNLPVVTYMKSIVGNMKRTIDN